MCSNNYGNDFIQRAKISDNKLVQEYCQERDLVFRDYTYQQSLEDFAEWVVKKFNTERVKDLTDQIEKLQKMKIELQNAYELNSEKANILLADMERLQNKIRYKDEVINQRNNMLEEKEKIIKHLEKEIKIQDQKIYDLQNIIKQIKELCNQATK